MPSRFLLPDVLVLAAGGVLGEAWMSGVLAGLEQGAQVDFRKVEAFVGTSAGSMVAASLVAGRPPRRPRYTEAHEPAQGYSASARRALPGLGAVAAAARLGAAATAPFVPGALAIGAPGAARARAAVLARLPGSSRGLDNLRQEVERQGARWDGRLRICAVDKASGRRVVFGAPGEPKATVGEAVAASCSVPWIFAPVTIRRREYVDGGVWSLTNLDVSPAGRGTQVLCLNVSAGVAVAVSSPLGALRAAATAAAAVEELALRRRGARVRTIGPDAAAARALGPSLMDPERGDAVLAAGYRQGLAAADRQR